jgi:hypothetical protein
MAALSDFMENKIIDWLMRAQAIGIGGATAAAGTGPATLFVGLLTTAPTDGAAGTEVSGNAYARVAVTSSLANWAGTQGAASVVASSGATGTTSNNAILNFPTPSPSGWGTVVAMGLYDAASAGNLLIYSALTISKTINPGDSVTFPAASLTFRIDD